ncbi:uncharacterized protein LY79DRAFT_560630 [Colletotrichum navitas]|uniref:Uncharacterized protein n=1 Tax=Colletotrichum navitas TaxID=681940 RepID=A0AAD8V384_9PEZI|nr:uncharacterized protein LY79DRAFT_560630 [Colletotrichum navitas]KAK1580674.1 hypothetical protein LY79DRAFT_560630 [Colletotrichum navitas]
MSRHRKAAKSSSASSLAPQTRVRKKASPGTEAGAKCEVSVPPDVKEEFKATEQSEKTTKRKVALKPTISPPAKRQKTTVIKPTENDTKTIATNPITPKKPGAIPQESFKPQFRTFPETPKTPSKVKDGAMDKMDESDSDPEPRSMAVHSSSSRRLKTEIAKLKSQIKKPKELASSIFTSAVHKDNDEKKNKCGLLAEAHSLSFGVQSLTKAITQLPVTEKNSGADIKKAVEHTEGAVVSEQLLAGKLRDGEEDTGTDLLRELFFCTRKR